MNSTIRRSGRTEAPVEQRNRGSAADVGRAPYAWLLLSHAGYDRGWLRGDAIVGLTVWAVREALAYVTLAVEGGPFARDGVILKAS
jgi:hypothetical protein